MVGGMVSTHRNLVGLARVSTVLQDAQLQRDALTAAGCGRVFEEKVSTRSTARPGLAAALDYLRPDDGDVLAVWKLDRLGRSVKDVPTIADDLHQRKVGLRILAGKLAGTYSPTGGGEVLLHDDGGVRGAGTRHSAGADVGRVGGGPRAGSGRGSAHGDGRRQARGGPGAPREGGEPDPVATALGVSRASVYRHLAAAEQPPPEGGGDEQARAASVG